MQVGRKEQKASRAPGILSTSDRLLVSNQQRERPYSACSEGKGFLLCRNSWISAKNMACRIADPSVFLSTGHHQRTRSQKIATLSAPCMLMKRVERKSVQRRKLYRKLEKLLVKGENHKKWLVPMKRTRTVQAVATPVAPSSADSAEYRKQLAESYGLRQIGEQLPDNITLKDVIDTLPKKITEYLNEVRNHKRFSDEGNLDCPVHTASCKFQVFEIDDVKAWKSVLVSVTSYAFGLFMISKAPLYLLPIAWAWTGTAVTGVSHDCAHKSFSRNKLVEDIVGTLAFLPLIYPYEPWRLQEDTAWHPVWKAEFDSSPILRKAIIFGYGPFRPWMSIAHWFLWHFDLKKFRSNEIQRVKISLACVFGFMVIGWPLIIYKAGIMGWIKFWLMPWLGYHFWMSTFTMVHHTAPHIPFKSSDEWNAAQAQLNGTVHCDYPSWIEILCHDINVHIPHHVSSRIPHYNLRMAHKSLQENWGKYLNEAKWNWRLMKTIMTLCHVYDKEENYVAFDQLAPEESQPIAFLKSVMPDYA
ncbi:hypothetical protein SADUNF_Sadunf06G0144900 [Salix dunnii]|uniref:Fatty acid desaturase domain-containing protein n=1 Tax=Salix dunnii TaxID=1413687 RepID=A0A835N332_9ROSI|nr:hypothetical protein SADUNF_Sadunf06G0144900 [Salix dunnii]